MIVVDEKDKVVLIPLLCETDESEVLENFGCLEGGISSVSKKWSPMSDCTIRRDGAKTYTFIS